MKTMKLMYPLAFALAITLASTGCKHKPVNVTNIPGMQPPMVPDVNPRTVSGPGSGPMIPRFPRQAYSPAAGCYQPVGIRPR